MRCPACNALNNDEADWCSLCFHRLKELPTPPAQPTPPPSLEPEPELEGATEPAPGPFVRATGSNDLAALFLNHPPARVLRPEHRSAVVAVTGQDPSASVIKRTGDAIVWTCPRCNAANPIGVEVCPVCSTPFFDAFRETKQLEVHGKSAAVAAAMSVIPGAGHLYLGRTAEGVGRIVLAVWWFGVGFGLRTSLPVMQATKLLFVVAGILLMGLSIGDAYRVVESPGAPPLLGRKVILYTSLGLVTLLVMAAVGAALAIRL